MTWASGELIGAASGRCGVHGTRPGLMRDARGSDAVTAIGKDETVPSGAIATHDHQSLRSDLWVSQAYPYPLRWRRACTAPRAAAIDPGAGQRAVGNLLERQKGDGRARHRDVPEAHQSNGGAAACEVTKQQKGMRGEGYSYVGVERAPAACVARDLKTATTVAAALVGERG